MSAIPYLFYRYSLTKNNRVLTPNDLWNVLCDHTNIEVPYRKSQPTEHDKDTSWIMPENYDFEYNNKKYQIISCYIARHITIRLCNGYDKANDTIYRKETSTDEYALCRCVFIPFIGIVAFADLLGDKYISANSAASRFAAIIKDLTDIHISIKIASTYADLKDALHKWTLTDFSYTARPFNPSIRKPGDMLHQLTFPDNAKLIGHAKPNKEGPLIVSENGFINEIAGLAKYGYAEYGAKGTTPSGFQAKISKPKTGKGVDTEAKIKIYVPIESGEKTHILNVATTALETYHSNDG